MDLGRLPEIQLGASATQPGVKITNAGTGNDITATNWHITQAGVPSQNFFSNTPYSITVAINTEYTALTDGFLVATAYSGTNASNFTMLAESTPGGGLGDTFKTYVSGGGKYVSGMIPVRKGCKCKFMCYEIDNTETGSGAFIQLGV